MPKAKANWNVKAGIVPLFDEGAVYEVTHAQFEQANRDSPGCLSWVEVGEAPVSAPRNRMQPGAPETAMSTRNMPGLAPQSAPAEEAPAEVKEEVDATPAAIELATEKGINLAQVKGSGKNGRITLGDVKDLTE
jgi:2-oxoglutarate dehydrogenase E2 component (dihydrolipoamide succinyltransferase)